MSSDTSKDDVRVLLDRLGIVVVAEDIPFLQRTLLRQHEFARRMGERVPAETEPAHVFRATD